MPLLSLWNSNQIAVNEFSIEQVVTTAGDGNLKDGSVCSNELREFFAQIPTAKIAVYVDQCLTSSVTRSGLVLQDLINELGRRLEYQVTNGRYQGVVGQIGFDGIWASPEGHAIVAEVKTTDAYRVSLDTLAGYRNKLTASGAVERKSSILIVVGRQDTGELEAQIRGSRHAWDVRLISAEALIKLVQLKENAEGPETVQKIRSLLTPMEYTRLDAMVDVMFTTVTAVEAVEIEREDDEGQTLQASPSSEKHSWEFTNSGLLQNKRDSIIAAMSKKRGNPLIRKSRALYWSADHEIRIVCSISKRYARDSSRYWYAYHPQWDEFLGEAKQSYFVLGCMDLDFGFAIERDQLISRLQFLNTTTREDGSAYWHIHIVDRGDNSFALALPKASDTLPLEPFKIDLD